MTSNERRRRKTNKDRGEGIPDPYWWMPILMILLLFIGAIAFIVAIVAAIKGWNCLC
jgi:hypothetical protein